MKLSDHPAIRDRLSVTERRLAAIEGRLSAVLTKGELYLCCS